MIEIPVVKDLKAAHPVPTVWRETLRRLANAIVGAAPREIVDTLVASDLSGFRANTAAYGEEFGNLPDQTWESSLVQWMGNRWDVLVDLFSSRGERTDLVMFVEVVEGAKGYEFRIDSVHVP